MQGPGCGGDLETTALAAPPGRRARSWRRDQPADCWADGPSRRCATSALTLLGSGRHGIGSPKKKPHTRAQDLSAARPSDEASEPPAPAGPTSPTDASLGNLVLEVSLPAKDAFLGARGVHASDHTLHAAGLNKAHTVLSTSWTRRLHLLPTLEGRKGTKWAAPGAMERKANRPDNL